ncbi:MAG: hypothetical protein HQ552_12860 [Desulfobacteraceae bacterium]|nr:hypothetical protein [Desulfobacteraceae bacterium]
MKSIVILLTAFVLGGCAIMRSTDPYLSVSMPSRSLSARTSPPVSPAKMPEGPLTLQRAIEVALANNPEVTARGWDATAAQARRDQAFGARLPRLGIVSGYAHSLDEQRLIAASKNAEPGLLQAISWGGGLPA